MAAAIPRLRLDHAIALGQDRQRGP